MTKVAEILGQTVAKSDPLVAVVRCNGTCEARPRVNTYIGAKSCKIESTLYSGETGCSYGCLGNGDCVAVCDFDAIHMNPETGLPEVDEDKCTACGSCVKACPKMIIELRKKGPKGRRLYVSCVNKDKGGVARECPTGAIHEVNFPPRKEPAAKPAPADKPAPAMATAAASAAPAATSSTASVPQKD